MIKRLFRRGEDKRAPDAKAKAEAARDKAVADALELAKDTAEDRQQAIDDYRRLKRLDLQVASTRGRQRRGTQ